MAREFSRAERVAEQVQRELAVLIQQEMKDPRLGMATVSTVEVSKDLALAKVYFTVMGGAEDHAVSVGILSRASGYLRHLLGGRLKMRVVPELRFVYDETIDKGAKLMALIERSNPSDQ